MNTRLCICGCYDLPCSLLDLDQSTPSPVVDAPVGSVTPVNRWLCTYVYAVWPGGSAAAACAFIQEGGSRRLSAVRISHNVWALYCWTTRYHGVQAVCCNSDSVQGVSLVLFGTGQKVRTVCLPARSTLILLSTSAEGGMNIQIKSALLGHYYLVIHYFVSLTSGVPSCTICLS